MKNTNQKILAPHYIKGFNCIGAACEDTCCAGWYIAIDEGTYKKYKKVKDKEMKKRLDKELVARKGGTTPDHVAKIKLKNGRCAFLSKEGWCDIYTSLGEGYLSHTCTLYPRTINQVDDRLEYSITFSCPEAARHILLNEEPIRFESLDQDTSVQTISAQIKTSKQKPQKWQDYFLELREMIIFIVQNRKYTMEERVGILGEFMKDLDKLVGLHNLKKIQGLLEEYKMNMSEGKIKLPQHDLIKESKDAIKMIQYLRAFSQEKKLPSKRYLECLDEILVGLELKEQVDRTRAIRCYKEGYSHNYAPFMKEREYILENYLVNYVFERCIPLDGKMPTESFRRMKLYYMLIKCHLVGIARAHKGLNEEDVVKLVQAFSKVFDHNEQYFLEVMNIYYNGK